jgi:hypothetical protein
MAQPIVIADLRGGRNGVDSAIDPTFPAIQCCEAFNIDFDEHAPLGRKRGGISSLSLTGGTAPSGSIHSLIRHVPAGDETAAELFLVDSAGTPVFKRLAGGTNWATVSPTDNLVTPGQDGVVGVTFNGKLHLFYDSAVDRSHVWDGTSLRVTGFADPTTAPTVADTGAGAYPPILRYYRARFIEVSGSILVRRSEPTDSVSFTPSGAGVAARVTRPTAPGEGETHWEMEWSSDNQTWYRYSSFENGTHVAIATTFQDDNDDAATNSARGLSDPLGYHTTFPSFKFGITDGNRLLMGGSHEGGLGSRVYHTPVLGSQNKGDDERLVDVGSRKPYTDLNEKDGGQLTGLGGPIERGVVFAFKYRQVWFGTPTGDLDVPYIWRNLTRLVGAVNHKSIVLGEDDRGRVCVYFWSHKGPYRLGSEGLQYMGRDIEDIIFGYGSFSSGVNLSATGTVCHGIYHTDKSRVEFYLATGSNNSPNIRVACYVKQANRMDKYGVRGGWVYHSLPSALARCSCLFSNTVGASMSKDLKPYLGFTDATVGKSDDDSDGDDLGTDFQAFVRTKSIVPTSHLGRQFGIRDPILIAEALANVSVQASLIYDMVASKAQSSTVDLTAISSDGTLAAGDHIIRKFSGGGQSDMGVCQIQIGDAAAQEGQWHLDAIILPYFPERET